MMQTAYPRLTLKHTPPPARIASTTPVLGVGFVTVPKDPQEGGPLGLGSAAPANDPPGGGPLDLGFARTSSDNL